MIDPRTHYDFDPKNYTQPTPKAPLPKVKPVKYTAVQRIFDTVSREHLLRASTGQNWVAIQDCEARWYWPLRSGRFRNYLIDQHRERYGRLPSDGALRAATRLMEGCCTPMGAGPARRIGGDGRKEIVLDLADRPAGAVEITPEGWTYHFQFDKCPFYRPQGIFDIPKPEGPGSLEPLRELLHAATPADWLRIQAWLLATLRPQGPYPILVLQGPSGCGKSVAARMLRGLIDPAESPFTPLPANERRLHSLALQNWVLAFDHVSSLPPSMSDALCRLSSGAGFSMKETSVSDPLYFDLQRPMILTVPGNTTWHPSAELQERMLVAALAPRAAEDRRPESELQEKFKQVQPAILAGLCGAVSMALRRRQELPAQGTDAEIWAQAAAPALNATEQEMREALATSKFQTRPDPLINQIDDLVSNAPNQEWTGTATELLGELPEHDRPAGANKLTEHLTLNKPKLRARGIEVTFSHKSLSRPIHIKKAPSENESSPAVSPSPSPPVLPFVFPLVPPIWTAT